MSKYDRDTLYSCLTEALAGDFVCTYPVLVLDTDTGKFSIQSSRSTVYTCESVAHGLLDAEDSPLDGWLSADMTDRDVYDLAHTKIRDADIEELFEID